MSDSFHTARFEHEGRTFEVALYYDNDADPPWDNEDGHGPVREVRRSYGSRPKKSPGERFFENHRGDVVYAYDWAEAVRIARKEWGLSDEAEAELRAKLGREPTKGEIAAEAVRRDFEYLRGYLREDWWYVGVDVHIIGPDNEPVGEEFEHAVWSVDYKPGQKEAYWLTEVAHDLAYEILSERREAWRAALHEARERRYWEMRDVITN